MLTDDRANEQNRERNDDQEPDRVGPSPAKLREPSPRNFRLRTIHEREPERPGTAEALNRCEERPKTIVTPGAETIAERLRFRRPDHAGFLDALPSKISAIRCPTLDFSQEGLCDGSDRGQTAR